MRLPQCRSSFSCLMMLAVVFLLGCGGPAPLTVDMPLHLEEHLDAATIVGSEVPADLVESVEWRFDEPQPDWRAAEPLVARFEAVNPVRADDALRLPLTAENRGTNRMFGMIYVDLPDWSLDDWGYVEIRARTRDPMRVVGLQFNYTEEDPLLDYAPFYAWGDQAPLVTDGTVQTYRLSLGDRRMREWEGPWSHLGIWFNSQNDAEAVTLDILSIRVIPREAEFAGDRVGVRTEQRSNALSRTLYTHAPGRLEYHVKVPEAGRLDFGLGVLSDAAPVTFAISATQQDGAVETLLEETYADREHWGQRSVDLSHLAGQTVTLALEADAERAGTVALWVAPTVSGARTTEKPNVIFYIIDGGGADLMSVYGYNRRTTPNLERLAAEGAVFEHAYSNSTWTRPSTASFLTSLQHSVLGGFNEVGMNPVPDQVLTIAEHMHRAGYQTAEFTSNSNAGRMSNLERGNDVFRDFYLANNSVSSVSLHEDFWQWRETYPAEPYWVHFQTTDVHGPYNVPAPFAGLYVSPQQTATLEEEWWPRLEGAGFGDAVYSEGFEKAEVDRQEYFGVFRGLYDEAMAHQDYQLGRFVERLKATGEWDNTLLIVAADHGHVAGSAHFGVGEANPLPPPWEIAMASSHLTRIPLMIFWPARIPGGQRFDEPVSMIDMLPTILDLAGLPMPEVMQGQSLAPLLLDQEGWEARPVVLDEFDRGSGELRGTIEVIDGRWAASLFIDPRPEESRIPLRGHHHDVTTKQGIWNRRPQSVPRLFLYDLWNDPFAFYSVHEEHPDLVEKYTAFLEAQFEAHQALAQLFTRSESVALTPEQLETLRALGYIQ